MESFLSDSDASDDHTEGNGVGSRPVVGGGTILSSDDDDAPPPQAPESPAKVRRGSMRRSRPQHPTIQVRSSAASSASSSSSARGQVPNVQFPEQEALREQITRQLEEKVENLNAEMRELRQENEDYGQKSEQVLEQMKAREQSWSSQQKQREAKIRATWEDERMQRDHLTRERWRMAREDERTALQREVVLQVHKARNILSHQGSALVRRSEYLASENVKLEKLAQSQTAKHASQQQLVAELREAVSHAENRQVQLEDQASIADKRYREAEAHSKQVSAMEAARFENVVADLRSELSLVDRGGSKAEAAELRYARAELAQARCENHIGEVAHGSNRLCDSCFSKDGQPAILPRQEVLARGGGAIVSALLQQLQVLCQDGSSVEGNTSTIGIKRKDIRALDTHTRKLERANSEWASHLVEQGLASQEWAMLLSQGATREGVSNQSVRHLLEKQVCVVELQRAAEKLRRLQARLRVLCKS